MGYGIWSSYFIEYSPEEMVKLFSKKGWGKLELSDEHGAMLLERGNPKVVGNKFKKYAEEFGVTFPQGHLLLSADIVDSDELEIVDTLKRWLDLFLAVGVKAAVLHPGGFKSRREGVPNEKIRTRQAQVLRQLTKHIENTDMFICLENMSKIEAFAEDLIDIIETTGEGNLGICLDTGHLNIAKGDQEEFIKKSREYLLALHIADNEGTSDQHMMPYGKGNVDWDKVVGALKEIEYDGLWNLEIPGERLCPFEIKLEKLDYLKAMMSIMLK